MSDGGRHKKSLQVIPSMAKLINLIYSRATPPRFFALLLLMGDAGHRSFPESEGYLCIADQCYISQMFWLQGPNLGFGSNGTTGWPVTRKGFTGYRVSIVGMQKHTEGKQAHDRDETTPISPSGCGKLIELRRKANKFLNATHTDLIHYIGHIDVLKLAYELIKSKPGNLTPGITKETLDGISEEYFINISRQILAGKFKFSPARRIWIPKPGKTEKRPLGIASPREKVVQKAMELVLSSIFEPTFLDTSHGFRPQKSTHSALELIDKKFKGATWFIEADIAKCFDTICHDRLMSIISRRISCQKTLALIRSGLKAGYVELGGVCERGLVGTPQGSVLSPLLCNIFLHELDVFMEGIMKRFDKGKSRRQNSTYTSILNRMAKLSLEKKLNLRKELRKVPTGDPMDPNFVRVRYVRYADDFLISVIGPHSLASEIKSLVGEFLDKELRLKMSESKTLITHASKEKASFLGAEIQWRTHSNKKVILTKAGKKSRITARIALLAPIEKLIRKLVIRKFMKWNPSGTQVVPVGLKRLQNLDHADIVAYYNAVIRGILSYYTFADNRSYLGVIARMLRYSCARTFALKYKLRFMAKVFKKFGSSLKCPDKGVSLYIPDTLKRIRQFNLSQPATLEMLEKSWANKLTRSNLGRSCIICNGIPAEMHHVRKLKELKERKLDWFTMQMAAINRKQVPLCKLHHTKLHQNQFTPVEMEIFRKRL